MSGSSSEGYAVQAPIYSGANETNSVASLFDMLQAGMASASLVKVLSVTGGGISTPPRVSVQPMVHQVDGAGNVTPHGEIYDIPVFRLQGGNGAVVLDPVAGDIGQAIICDRDISSVKSTAAIAAPGSFRRNDWSDGCYFGGFLNAAPTRYVQFSSSGTTILDPTQIDLKVGGMGITITASGTTIDGKPFLPHEHSGVQTGAGNTGGVV